MTKPWLAFNFYSAATLSHKPLIAISACLHGEAVRYDGTAKKLLLLSELAETVDLYPVCPEVGAGMAIPRPPIQLQKQTNVIAAIGRDDSTLDMTTALQQYAPRSIAAVEHRLSGYIFKSRSPSCGVESTPLFDPQGQTIGLTSGIQAKYIQTTLPWLPLREEQQLATPEQCQQFIMHCLIMQDLINGYNHAGAEKLNQHYSPLQSRFNVSQRKQLDAERNQPDSYWQLFSEALAGLELETITN
ncbi:DUF523 domain-containing protein [Oceanicoccus sp. KOV_DT_Chl]|uniref:DUF523 domain-containing protein n=1 Tax=Oceanicoccus sp. KOV_DT_Chl TaxID=1904639 RepID=UPI000C7CDE0F|nr:DUF523 domain-containing protein [Oceanicoccus sp. KOV_DT_Chl]